jgi:hypothetical protein
MLEKVRTLWEKAKVLGRSMPARVVAASTIVVACADQIAAVIPAEAAETPVAVAIQALAFVAAAIQIVRNVVLVPDRAKGLTLPAGKQMVVDVVGPPHRTSPPA